MWMQQAFSLLSSAAGRVYYRLTIAGDPVPRSGPLLLVANHPNSLLDPVLVAAAARRPVRFLAKAPLFTDPTIGWLIRRSGAIPVYRQIDDANVMDLNEDMFRAVHDALSDGAAIGVFPEGLTHNEPELAKLKTGAARIALGTAVKISRSFTILPVGLVFRRKDVFRSAALIVRGTPIDWDDLAGRPADDREAVRDLTNRIEAGMRSVTVNLERWEDKPLVECAEAIWTAEFEEGGGATKNRAHQMSRLELTTSALKVLRQNPNPRWDAVVRDVTTHCRRLKRLRLSPNSLAADVSLRASMKWTARRLPLFGLPAFAVAGIGYVLYWFPRHLTGRLVRIARPDHYQRSTFALMIGIVVYAVWLALWEVLTWWAAGYVAALVGMIFWPITGLTGVWVRERWHGSWTDIRSFFLLRSRRNLIQSLKTRQQELAVRLEELQEEIVNR